MTLLLNEGIMLVVATLWQDVFWSVLTLLCIHVSSIVFYYAKQKLHATQLPVYWSIFPPKGMITQKL